MVQGKIKMGASKKSAGALKKKVHNSKQKTKGPTAAAAKGRKRASNNPQKAVARSINKKNEATIASRVLASGNRLSIADLSDVGKAEIKKSKMVHVKKANKAKSQADRAQQELKKMGRL
mmetsp:Transcript_40573/g.79367  ORF Transcript_40573/g.79367 Transcript_40573/m.79367 type:complete len:119 (-) Transcript_40573:151-507(-)